MLVIRGRRCFRAHHAGTSLWRWPSLSESRPLLAVATDTARLGEFTDLNWRWRCEDRWYGPPFLGQRTNLGADGGRPASSIRGCRECALGSARHHARGPRPTHAEACLLS